MTVSEKITTPAACTAMGTTTYTAKVTVEGQEYTATTTRQDVAIDPSNHNNQIIKVNAEAATCTESGIQEHYKCSGCGKLYSDADGLTEITLEEVTIQALGHQWGEPVITFAEDGKTATAVVTCENDGNHTETPKAIVTSQVKTPSTCEAKGTTTYTATVEFNHNVYTAIKDVEDIAATGHKWGEPVITFSEDGKTATAVVICENDKTHTQKLDAKVTSQVKTPATKETMGITTYMASVEFAGKIYSVSEDMQDIPKVKPAETVEKVETQQLTETPESLKDTPYNTVEKIEKAMEEVVLQKIKEHNTGNEQKTITYDAVLMITENGVTRPATKEEVEARGGITIVIPYPAGTNRTDFVFTVAHMLTVDMAGMRAGDIETPQIMLTDAGLKVTLKGLSPVMVGYSKKAAPTEPTVPETTVPETTVPETTVPETTVPAKPNTPETGDEAPMMLWFLLGLVSACGVTVTALLRKKKGSVR